MPSAASSPAAVAVPAIEHGTASEPSRLLDEIRAADPAAYATITEQFPEIVPRLAEATSLDALLAEAGLDGPAEWPVFNSTTNFAEMQASLTPELATKMLIGQWRGAGAESAAPAAADDEEEAPPERLYRDFFPSCDVNHDGVKDIVTNDWTNNGYQQKSEIRAISGADGADLWYRDAGTYIPFMLRPFYSNSGTYGAPLRAGLPFPQWPTAPPNNFATTSDVNQDGVCDFLAYGFEIEFPVTPWTALAGFLWVEFNGTLAMLNGTNGTPLWTIQIHGVMQEVFCPPLLFCANRYEYDKYRFDGYPTGFLSYDSPSGPKFVWKTTDVTFEDTMVPFTRDNEEWLVQEHVTLGDARNGKGYWTFDMTPSPSVGNAPPLVTWLSGAADVFGGPEPDIVIDNNRLAVSVINGDPQVGVLDPVARVVWGPTSYFTPPPNTYIDNEEPPEVIYWFYCQIVKDITGDGYAEIVPSYFTGPPPGPRVLFSESYHTHFAPMNGRTGRLLWNLDQKFQGWGFATDLSVHSNITYRQWGWVPYGPAADNTSHPILAIGTLDVPTPKLPGTRFPPKFVHMAAVNVGDASSRWNYRARFGLDSYVSYDLSLWQILVNLAPHDWNGDGLRDFASASRYVQPDGGTQTLLANAKHEYQLLDSDKGKLIHQFQLWGPYGVMVPCDGDTSGQATVLSGHGKRIDLTRYDVGVHNRTWRRPVYNNPTPQSMTAGLELIFIGFRCGDDLDNRTMFGLDLGLMSLKRGFEILPPHGFVRHNDTLHWVLPGLRGNPPVDPSLDFIVAIKKEVPLAARIGFSAMPALPGLAIGMGLGYMRSRRRPPAGGAQ